MTSLTQIQAKVYGGYAKAASKFGVTCSIYRPDGVNDPISTATLITSAMASFSGAGLQGSRTGFNYEASLASNEAFVHALIDGRLVRVGDYVVSPTDTYFVGSLDPILPVLCVKCLQVVTISRPSVASPASFGAVAAYGGTQPATEIDLVRSVPVRFHYDRVGKAPDANLPAAATGRSQWKVLLPLNIAGAPILRGDTVIDAGGSRYIVDAAEQTNLGLCLRVDKLTV